MVKLGGNKDAARNTLQAQELGGRAVARGNEQLLNQQNLANQQIIQGAVAGEQAMNLRRQEKTQQQQFGAQMDLSRRAQDIEMADRGLEEREKPQAGQPEQDPNFVGPPSPMDQRMANLRESMARSKEVAEITDLGTNAGSRKTEIVKSESRVASERAAAAMEERQMRATETQAAATYGRAVNAAKEARLKGDKEAQALAQKAGLGKVTQTNNAIAKILNETNPVLIQNNIDQLKQDPSLQRIMASDPAFAAEVESGIVGPRTAAVLKSRRTNAQLNYIRDFGVEPTETVDPFEPGYRKFIETRDSIGGLMGYFGGSTMGQMLNWKSTYDKVEFFNKLAADAELEGYADAVRGVSQQGLLDYMFGGGAQQQGAQQNVQPGSQQPAPAPGGAAGPQPSAAAGAGQQQQQPSPIAGVAAPSFGRRRFPPR